MRTTPTASPAVRPGKLKSKATGPSRKPSVKATPKTRQITQHFVEIECMIPAQFAHAGIRPVLITLYPGAKDMETRCQQWFNPHMSGCMSVPPLKESYDRIKGMECTVPVRYEVSPGQWELIGELCQRLKISPSDWVLAVIADWEEQQSRPQPTISEIKVIIRAEPQKATA